MFFQPGRLILHRNVRHGRLGWVRPARVVLDDERGLLVWIARGTPVVNEVSADGRGMRMMPFTEWVTAGTALKHGTWDGPPVLKFLPSGAAHSVWWFRDDAGGFASWYVNLEEPGVRWDDGAVAGVDIVDQDLDIVVGPGGADSRSGAEGPLADVLRGSGLTWRWKDEEEFLERLALPDHYWVTDEAAVRAEGENVIKEIEAGVFPFDGTWVDFTPPPGFDVPPALPEGWDRPPVR